MMTELIIALLAHMPENRIVQGGLLIPLKMKNLNTQSISGLMPSLAIMHAMRYRGIHITTPSTLSNARQNEIKTLLFIRAQHYLLLSGCPQYELRPWFRLISPASPVLGTGLCLLPNERDNRPDN